MDDNKYSDDNINILMDLLYQVVEDFRMGEKIIFNPLIFKKLSKNDFVQWIKSEKSSNNHIF